MALSMDEQRILDAMEQKLADDDPRLASRLTAFGQPRLPALLGTGKARAAAVLISLALAAMMALMVYSMRPFPTSQGKQSHHAARVTPSPGGQTADSGSSGAARPATPRAS
jgi:hypothetical protein